MDCMRSYWTWDADLKLATWTNERCYLSEHTAN